jgi:ABC-type transport system involved in cytochrome c biogenesis permease subunit
MRISGRLLCAGLLLLLGTVLSFALPMPADWPSTVWHREAYRAFFFHLPYAFAGTLAFMLAAAHAARYLATRDLRADRAAWGAAELGLVFLFIATITGMVLAKTQWGAWWNWDPRETSVFFVLLLYAAYLLLRQALPDDPALRARLSSAYLLLAVAPMIWLVMIFPRSGAAGGSLHPKRAPIDAVHWRIIFVQLAGLLCLFAEARRIQDGIGRVDATVEG